MFFCYLSAVYIEQLKRISTYTKNVIYDNLEYFHSLDIVKNVRYWGMDGLVTKFTNIKHLSIDFYIASVEI